MQDKEAEPALTLVPIVNVLTRNISAPLFSEINAILKFIPFGRVGSQKEHQFGAKWLAASEGKENAKNYVVTD